METTILFSGEELSPSKLLGLKILSDPIVPFLTQFIRALKDFYPSYWKSLKDLSPGLRTDQYNLTLGRMADNLFRQIAEEFADLKASEKFNSSNIYTHIEVLSPAFLAVQSRVTEGELKKRIYAENLADSYTLSLFPPTETKKKKDQAFLEINHGFAGIRTALGFVQAICTLEDGSRVIVDLLELLKLRDAIPVAGVEQTESVPQIKLKNIETKEGSQTQ